LRHPGAMVRRQLIKSAVAAPVVLSSLASKPVLGAEMPYQCTVSGQVSGNLSRSADESVCAIGDSRSTWLGLTSWAAGNMTKGGPPNEKCNFTGPSTSRGTNFNGFSRSGTDVLIDAFFNNPIASGSDKSCSVMTTVAPGSPDPTPDPVNMYQVLSSSNADPKFELGRTVVVSLLNAYKFGSGYPVNAWNIIKMFNSTFNGGTYNVVGTVQWDREQVIHYLQLLYKPG
jgi:hypothetical protein